MHIYLFYIVFCSVKFKNYTDLRRKCCYFWKKRLKKEINLLFNKTANCNLFIRLQYWPIRWNIWFTFITLVVKYRKLDPSRSQWLLEILFTNTVKHKQTFSWFSSFTPISWKFLQDFVDINIRRESMYFNSLSCL